MNDPRNRTRHLRRTATLVLIIGVTAIASTPPIAAAEIQAPPGAVVRWNGLGIEQCTLDGRTYGPRQDESGAACFFPVDLLATGTLRASRRIGGHEETLAIRVGEYPYDVQRLTIEDTRRVDPLPQDLVRIEKENARIAPLWQLDGAAQDQLPLSAPLQKLPRAGRFGAKRILNGQPRSPHSGADYAANQGTPVLAAADGTVRLAEEHFFSGNSIFLDHGDGLITMYFHLHEIFVVPGQRVTRGAVIGTVGATGRVTGPHLHFAVRWHGARIDPAALLEPSRQVSVQ